MLCTHNYAFGSRCLSPRATLHYKVTSLYLFRHAWSRSDGKWGYDMKIPFNRQDKVRFHIGCTINFFWHLYPIHNFLCEYLVFSWTCFLSLPVLSNPRLSEHKVLGLARPLICSEYFLHVWLVNIHFVVTESSKHHLDFYSSAGGCRNTSQRWFHADPVMLLYFDTFLVNESCRTVTRKAAFSFWQNQS